AEAQRIACLGSWQLNIETQHVVWSDELLHILGFSQREIKPRLSVLLDHIPDEDRERFERAREALMVSGETQSLDMRIVRPNGDERILHGQMELLPGMHGHPARIVGTLHDITERRRAETESMRLVMAVEQAAESIMVTDVHGTIQYVNPAFERITGYTRDEAKGQTPRILKSGEQDTSFYRNMWHQLTEGEIWEGRLINRRKNGELYEEEATISPVRDLDGKIINYVAVKRDVTTEVQLSNRLRQAEKMEAIGTLAGGIAHDFNNLLAVILGYSEMARDDLSPESVPHENLLEEIQAATRAKE
ncbi:MAG: hypothetical protein QG656_2067, partial [Candidatus Hydrogenedentes bacterium]|nr:hypothetical protein [Candidatus Hydrogenedentota bacterium]